MQDVVFDALPSWLLFLVLVGGSVTLACCALWLVRRYWKTPSDPQHNEVAGFLFGTVGVIYATLLGFLVVSVWDQFQIADRAASQEAASLVTVIRYSAMLPEPARRQEHDLLREYIQLVSQEEWRAMSLGHGRALQSDHAMKDLNAIWGIYQQQPITATNSEAMRNLSEMGQERLLRLQSSTGGLPVIFWVVLVLGGGIVVGFSFLFSLEKRKLHLLLVGLMTFLIALCLWFLVVVNNPYDGDLQVSSQAFTSALQVLDGLPR